MKFKSHRQRRGFFAKLRDFSEYTKMPNYAVIWSATPESKDRIRVFVHKRNAKAQVKDVKEHGGCARIRKL